MLPPQIWPDQFNIERHIALLSFNVMNLMDRRLIERRIVLTVCHR